MIKKVFKTIFILTLCLGITLPANAGSVQVSDGSAFITKSELSYQLNNLSYRMTQLENSLDSKIDTLVSSYLTRNGIWNGSKQTLITPSYTIPARGSFTVVSGTSDYSVTGSTQQLFKANKSGMAYLNESWVIQSGIASNNWRYGGLIVGSSATVGSTDNKIFLTIYFKDITTNTLMVSWLLGSANGSVNSANEQTNMRIGVYIPVPGSQVYNSTIFFVNKDDLYGYYYFCGLFISYNHVKKQEYSFTNSNITINFISADVY